MNTKKLIMLIILMLASGQVFSKDIIVKNLSYKTHSDQLRAAFEEYGTVDSAMVIVDRETGRSRRFGFVEMPNEAEALEAIDALNDSELDDKTIVVEEREPRDSNERRRRINRGYSPF